MEKSRGVGKLKVVGIPGGMAKYGGKNVDIQGVMHKNLYPQHEGTNYFLEKIICLICVIFLHLIYENRQDNR